MSLKRLVAILWLLIVKSVTTVAQTIYVVSVGIADYQNINDLNYTEADVSLFNSIKAEHNAK